MPLAILLPMILVPAAAVAGFVVYRRALGRIGPDATGRGSGVSAMSGSRLTSEHLRRLPAPPWRVVFEIAPERLQGVDHVVIGPPGVIAIETVVADRPAAAITTDPTSVAAAAIARGGVGDLAERVGLRCDTLAKVFWGSPQPDRPPAVEVTHGSVAVEGQRLSAWLDSLPAGVLDAPAIDAAWRSISTGIGRPDPLG